jgi:hypothetical protein
MSRQGVEMSLRFSTAVGSEIGGGGRVTVAAGT